MYSSFSNKTLKCIQVKVHLTHSWFFSKSDVEWKNTIILESCQENNRQLIKLPRVKKATKINAMHVILFQVYFDDEDRFDMKVINYLFLLNFFYN